VVKLDDVFGKLTLPAESTISLTTDRLNLTGENGIWSHSLVLTSRGQHTCATIDVSESVKKLVAFQPDYRTTTFSIPFPFLN
jgi:hypothetical protein